MVFAWARREGLPLAWMLAGGYTPDVSKVVAVHLGTFDAARAVHGVGASARMTWVSRLFTAWTGVVMVFFYLPIAILILFSFNESRLNIVWTGFTFDWYLKLLDDRVLVRALQNSMIVASATTWRRWCSAPPAHGCCTATATAAAACSRRWSSCR